MDNMKSTITERGDHWHPDPEKDKKLGGPGANQRAREDRAAASKPKSDPKKRKSGESYMDYAKRHGYKKPTPKKKSLLGRLGLRKEAYRVLAKDKGEEGKPSQFSYKDEKDANKFADSIKKKGGRATVTKEHHQKDANGKVVEHGDGTPSSVEEGKGWQPEIEHSKLGDAKKKKDKERESKLPPHLQGDAIGKMKKAFAKTNEENIDEAERKLADRLARKRKVYDKTTKKAMKFARDEGEASGHARYRMSSISREMDGIKAKMKKEEVLVVDEGIGDMAIKAIEKTNPPYISKRSSMIRDIKLKQLKSYLKKQDDKKKKAASKD